MASSSSFCSVRSHGDMANVLDSEIVVSEFELDTL